MRGETIQEDDSESLELQSRRDQLDALGCSLEVWRKKVEEIISERRLREELELLRHSIYIPDSPEGALSVQEAFNARVRNILDFHRQANTALNEQADPIVDALKDTTVLHITFSGDAQLGGAPVNGEKRNFYLSSVVNACEAQDWKGVVSIDLSEISEKQSLNSEENEHITDLEILADVLNKKSNKPIIVIIDGYGTHAAQDLGFAMFDRYFQIGSILTLVIRTTKEQDEADMGFGSIWSGKAPHITSLAQSPDRSTGPFDREKLVNFAVALNIAVARAEGGEVTCVQAPNNYGKSTALEALVNLPSDAIRGNITFLYISSDGLLRNIKNQAIIKEEDLKMFASHIVIIDEAGRVDVPEAKAKELLNAMQAQDIKIVRVYPGNVATPSEYNVINIGSELEKRK